MLLVAEEAIVVGLGYLVVEEEDGSRAGCWHLGCSCRWQMRQLDAEVVADGCGRRLEMAATGRGRRGLEGAAAVAEGSAMVERKAIATTAVDAVAWAAVENRGPQVEREQGMEEGSGGKQWSSRMGARRKMRAVTRGLMIASCNLKKAEGVEEQAPIGGDSVGATEGVEQQGGCVTTGASKGEGRSRWQQLVVTGKLATGTTLVTVTTNKGCRRGSDNGYYASYMCSASQSCE
ncbi:hypothetical protein BHE74_00045829 [Ensete ventricosum]|nr:hypothetical protein BHE74_00045829 [Ensete ventricosum]